MRTLIIAMGFHSLFFAVFHMLFWTKLHWNKELPKLSNVNNAVMQILNLRLIHYFLFLTVLCFAFTDSLLHSPLGAASLVGSALFWLGRTLEQLIFKRLLPVRAPISIVLSLLFVLGFIGFLLPVIL